MLHRQAPRCPFLKITNSRAAICRICHLILAPRLFIAPMKRKGTSSLKMWHSIGEWKYGHSKTKARRSLGCMTIDAYLSSTGNREPTGDINSSCSIVPSRPPPNLRFHSDRLYRSAHNVGRHIDFSTP